jgi:CheY-like chemotaxis protein
MEGVVERASSLVSQLMTFSRKEKPVHKLLDLNAVLSGQARMIEQLIPENIELTILPGQELGLVRIDSGQLAEALINLVLNAKDAMPTGGKLILETSNVSLDENYTDNIPGMAPGRYALVSVSDTGKGMDAETKRRAFEPFFTTKPPGEGTGLGLAVVYATVKQVGGHVSVYSEQGMGTTFKIYLPTMSGEVAPEEVATGRLEKTEQVVADNGTILLVEDEASIREPAREYLAGLGYKVLLAGNGQEALRVAQRYKRGIDLMLTDVVMPRMGGAELAIQMKEIHPETRSLYMSGYSREILAEHLQPTVGEALLRKPFSLEALAQQVRQAISDPSPVPSPEPAKPGLGR